MTKTLTEQQIIKIIENVTGKAAKVCKQKFYDKPKTLTEQWREGTLRGCYYWGLPNGNICSAYTDTMRDIKKVRDSNEVEVLCEVPSYVEYTELVSKTEQLEKQLAIATKALKEYADKTNWVWGNFMCVYDGKSFADEESAEKTLKEMEGVK